MGSGRVSAAMRKVKAHLQFCKLIDLYGFQHLSVNFLAALHEKRKSYPFADLHKIGLKA
jgi:hypothetical protein